MDGSPHTDVFASRQNEDQILIRINFKLDSSWSCFLAPIVACINVWLVIWVPAPRKFSLEFESYTIYAIKLKCEIEHAHLQYDNIHQFFHTSIDLLDLSTP